MTYGGILCHADKIWPPSKSSEWLIVQEMIQSIHIRSHHFFSASLAHCARNPSVIRLFHTYYVSRRNKLLKKWNIIVMSLNRNKRKRKCNHLIKFHLYHHQYNLTPGAVSDGKFFKLSTFWIHWNWTGFWDFFVSVKCQIMLLDNYIGMDE